MDKHESIIISTDQKYALLFAVVVFLILTALKGFVIGYLIGKRCK